MRRLVLPVIAALACLVPSPRGAEAGTVISMPPPPAPLPAANGAGGEGERARPATPTIDVGTVALHRYGRVRPRPAAGGWGYGAPYGASLYGGYRISLSPYTFYGYRAWNGGYVYPWLYGYAFFGHVSFGHVHHGLRSGMSAR